MGRDIDIFYTIMLFKVIRAWPCGILLRYEF